MLRLINCHPRQENTYHMLFAVDKLLKFHNHCIDVLCSTFVQIHRRSLQFYLSARLLGGLRKFVRRSSVLAFGYYNAVAMATVLSARPGAGSAVYLLLFHPWMSWDIRNIQNLCIITAAPQALVGAILCRNFCIKVKVSFSTQNAGDRGYYRLQHLPSFRVKVASVIRGRHKLQLKGTAVAKGTATVVTGIAQVPNHDKCNANVTVVHTQASMCLTRCLKIVPADAASLVLSLLCSLRTGLC